MKIYLDMDGVLCDFFGKVYQSFPELKNYKTIPEDLLWDSIKTIDNFWETLEPFEGFKSFVSSCQGLGEVYILSGYSTHDYERSIKGKLEWLSKFLPEIPKENSFIVHRREKKDYATKEAILVDDYLKNVKDFSFEGGIGIHHTSFKESYMEILWEKARFYRSLVPIEDTVFRFTSVDLEIAFNEGYKGESFEKFFKRFIDKSN